MGLAGRARGGTSLLMSEPLAHRASLVQVESRRQIDPIAWRQPDRANIVEPRLPRVHAYVHVQPSPVVAVVVREPPIRPNRTATGGMRLVREDGDAHVRVEAQPLIDCPEGWPNWADVEAVPRLASEWQLQALRGLLC